MKDSSKGGKYKKEGRGVEGGGGEGEYSNNLRDVMRKKIGFKSKEWKQLDGSKYEMVDEAYIVYLG